MSDILKEQGNEEFKAKNFDRAAQLYGDAVKLDPTNPVLYSNMAMALIKLSKWLGTIEACDKGLEYKPDNKTKVKLLYRRGTAYSKVNDFRNARESYHLALIIDEKNASVTKSMEDLKSQESQFKRSHSIEEFEAEKKIKTQSNIERIPIYEVDKLPDEFQDKKTKHTSSPQTSSPIIASTKSAPASSSASVATHTTGQPQYPERPTIYQLVSITKCSQEEKPRALNYFFSISPHTYRALFSGGSIEPALINFILESIISAIDHNHYSVELIDKILSILNEVSSAPRFSLVSMFANKSNLQIIKDALNDKVDHETLQKTFKKW